MPHREIFKNTFFQLVARFSTTIVGLLITLYIARVFGVSGYGDFTKIISVVTLFYLVVDFGLNAIFIREKNFSFGELLYSRIGIAFILFILLNLVVYFLPFDSIRDIGFSPVVKFGVLIFSLSLFNQAIIFSTAAIFQKKMKYEYFMVSQAIGALSNLLLVLILVHFYSSVDLVVTSFVLSGIIASIVSLFFVEEKIGHLKLKIPRELFIQSFPIGIMLLFNLIYFRIDTILLSFLKSTQDVGIYGISYKVFDVLLALPLFLSNSLYPHLLKNRTNTERFKKMVNKYSLVFFFSSLVVLMVFWISAPLFVLISRGFDKAVLPFRILILGLPFFFLSSFYQWLLITIKQQNFLMKIYFWLTVLNIALNLIFIPKGSYIASALITGVCEVVVLIALVWRYERFKDLSKDEK